MRDGTVYAWSSLAWVMLFFAAPLTLLVVMSFWTLTNDFTLDSTFTFQNYRQLLTPVYFGAIAASLRLALVASVMSAALAIPMAYWITFRVARSLRLLLLFMLLVPFVSNYTIRTLAWQLWLNDTGVLAWLKGALTNSISPLRLIYTDTATLIGLISLLLPICTLVITLALSRTDTCLIQAARNLGASGIQVLRFVVMPYAVPGVMISLLYGFIITLGDVVSGGILGGNKTYTSSVLIQDRMKIGDWPGAAAIGVAMLIVCLISIGLMFWTTNKVLGRSSTV